MATSKSGLDDGISTLSLINLHLSSIGSSTRQRGPNRRHKKANPQPLKPPKNEEVQPKPAVQPQNSITTASPTQHPPQPKPVTQPTPLAPVSQPLNTAPPFPLPRLLLIPPTAAPPAFAVANQLPVPSPPSAASTT